MCMYILASSFVDILSTKSFGPNFHYYCWSIYQKSKLSFSKNEQFFLSFDWAILCYILYNIYERLIFRLKKFKTNYSIWSNWVVTHNKSHVYYVIALYVIKFNSIWILTFWWVKYFLLRRFNMGWIEFEQVQFTT